MLVRADALFEGVLGLVLLLGVAAGALAGRFLRDLREKLENWDEDAY